VQESTKKQGQGMAHANTHGHEPIQGALQARVSILVRRKRLVWSRHFDQAVARQTFDNKKLVKPEVNILSDKFESRWTRAHAQLHDRCPGRRKVFCEA